jgi:hypothetical protein
MRDRLVELLKGATFGVNAHTLVDHLKEESIEAVADHLLAKGVIVPPRKVGDTVYHLTSEEVFGVLNCVEIYEGKVFSMAKDEDGLWLYCRYDNGLKYWYSETDIGKCLFLTREEAEAEMERRKNND